MTNSKDNQNQNEPHETAAKDVSQKSISAAELLQINPPTHSETRDDDDCLTLKKRLSKLIKPEYKMQLPSVKASALMVVGGAENSKIFTPQSIEFQYGLLKSDTKQSSTDDNNGDQDHDSTREISPTTEGLHCVRLSHHP